MSVAGLESQVEVIRDPWGVPHIFAETDDDAYFALGFVHAQDRLFQLDLNRHIGQARLAELLGEPAVEVDRLFRTMDLHGTAARMLARARPEARAASTAYARGVNAAVAELGGRLPLEFVLLGHRFEPAKPDDFVGILGYMAWQLNISWIFDPLYEQLVAELVEHAAELFPTTMAAHPRCIRRSRAVGRTPSPDGTPRAWSPGGRESICLRSRPVHSRCCSRCPTSVPATTG